FSPVISEGYDLSGALLTLDGRLVTHGRRDIPAHFGTFEETARAVLRRSGDARPGDVFIFNDPYSGGTHTLDVRLIRPIFHNGEPIAMSTQTAQWPDCGGPIPGTFNPLARDAYAEGLRLPAMKLFSEEQEVEEIFDLIRMNVRVFPEIRADIHAQY